MKLYTNISIHLKQRYDIYLGIMFTAVVCKNPLQMFLHLHAFLAILNKMLKNK